LQAIKQKKERSRITNCIAFSRQIGVGALEIADAVSARLDGMRVADREILEHIARNHHLGERTIDSFDERYPGVTRDLSAMLFGEKSFTMDDYMRYLTGAVYALADDAPTIFVGRGAHLILPRSRVLAVRFIASKDFRVRRVADILGVTEDLAARELQRLDKQQHEFFRKNFNKDAASPQEFDMVVNRDHFDSAEGAAAVVAGAYHEKFQGSDYAEFAGVIAK